MTSQLLIPSLPSQGNMIYSFSKNPKQSTIFNYLGSLFCYSITMELHKLPGDWHRRSQKFQVHGHKIIKCHKIPLSALMVNCWNCISYSCFWHAALFIVTFQCLEAASHSVAGADLELVIFATCTFWAMEIEVCVTDLVKCQKILNRSCYS